MHICIVYFFFTQKYRRAFFFERNMNANIYYLSNRIRISNSSTLLILQKFLLTTTALARKENTFSSRQRKRENVLQRLWWKTKVPFFLFPSWKNMDTRDGVYDVMAEKARDSRCRIFVRGERERALPALHVFYRFQRVFAHEMGQKRDGPVSSVVRSVDFWKKEEEEEEEERKGTPRCGSVFGDSI